MPTFIKIVLICMTLSVSALNAILVANDSAMESAIAEAKDNKRSELVENGATENEIENELTKVEQKLKIINQWQKSELKDFIAATVFASFVGFVFAALIYFLFVKRVYIKTQLCIIILVSLIPALWQAYLFGTDARGLVILSSIESKDFSFNPYSKNGGFISPIMASWIYINYPELYKECGVFSERLDQCDMPLVFYIGNTLDYGSNEVKERQYDILTETINRGASITAAYDGLAPIHQAILFNNSRYTELLIESGTDINQIISNPSKPYDGFDAIEYLNYLDQKGKRDFVKLRAIINEKLNK